MQYSRLLLLAVTLAVASSAGSLRAQARVPKARTGDSADSKGEKEEKPKYKPLPNDKRLLALHQEFVREAERLAGEYERNKEYGKALDVYGEILKLVPQYAPARAKFQLLRQRQATAETASLEVRADRPWQPTGIQVLQGKPITIRATGVWTFHLTRKLGPDGMPIPEELRDYNLGCLIGVIDTGNPKEMKPFVVGSQKSFLAEQTGQLLLRMYDDQPADNEGTLRVQVMGTFEKR